jgi:arylsulfatase A-like enzyme
MADRPNLLLLMTDQHRFDCLSCVGSDHPVHTPFLDDLAAGGTRFTNAYSACPVCVPARRTLMTGTRPSTHGLLMNGWCDLPFPTLPQVLHDVGYQTHLVGKLHFKPGRARFGFESTDWADGPWHHGSTDDFDNDYFRFLADHGISRREAIAHGMTPNGHPARPWHLDERFHFSNWAADRSLEFLERRDPTCPFFLKMSLIHPHQPLTPPAGYLEKYLRPEVEIPPPVVGDWARADTTHRSVDEWRIDLPAQQMRYMRAAYYATIEHLDHQFGRVLRSIPKNTVVIFCSDHGEMLGDHRWMRKRTPYDGSAHVPLIVNTPGGPGGQTCEKPVELMDVMPTFLDAAGVAAPETVEGRTLLPLCHGEPVEWRDHLHGECAQIPKTGSGMQYLTDGRRKYVYWPGTGAELFFDLDIDPDERHDLATSRPDEVKPWRQKLVDQLADRPEGFVKDGKLQVLGGPTTATPRGG